MIKSLKHRKGNIMKNIYLTSDMEIWDENKSIGAIDYLIINDVDEFFNFFGAYNMQSFNVNKIGFYQWSDYNDAWEEITEEPIKILENLKKINENNSTESDVIWNLKITLLYGEEIKTNNKSCSLKELFEAIQAMQKPSLFGKQVKSFTIYKE